jgi:hypothetical protein
MNANTIQSFNVNADSIQVMTGGKLTVVPRGAANFETLRQALIANPPRLDDALKNLTVDAFIRAWAKEPFTLEGSYSDGTLRVSYKGEAVPADLNERIVQMAANSEDPTPLFNFWERLERNPSARSVEQLWAFLKQQNIPVQPDGTFLAYKGINADMTDKHSGKIRNDVGSVHEMPRNKVSDDPHTACHYGFHVGAKEYAVSFGEGGAVIICKVDPEHVVCVPYDSSQQKMRVCKYAVYGFYGGDMASTTLDPEDDPNDFGVGEDDVDLQACPDCGHEWDQHNETGCTAFITIFSEENPEDAESCECTLRNIHDEPIVTEADEQTHTYHKPKVAKKWAKHRYQTLPYDKLLEEPIDKLRKFATKGLRIVAASKIPGGRLALVKRICEVRG